MIKTVDRVILFSLELNSFDKDCYRCQLLRMQSIVNDLVIDLWEMGSASSHPSCDRAPSSPSHSEMLPFHSRTRAAASGSSSRAVGGLRDESSPGSLERLVDLSSGPDPFDHP